MNNRDCLSFLLIIFCASGMIKAQESKGKDCHNEIRPIMYGCDEKMLEDLIPKIELVKVTNENISFKLSLIEKTLVQNIEHSLKEIIENIMDTMLKNVSKELMKSINDFEDKLNNKQKAFEDTIIKTNSESLSPINSSADAMNEIKMVNSDRILREEVCKAIEKQNNDGFIRLEKQMESIEISIKQLYSTKNETLMNIDTEVETTTTKKTIDSTMAAYTDKSITCKTESNPKDCAEVLDNSECPNGVYMLHVSGVKDFDAYCMRDHNDKNSPAWTIIQRRQKGNENFFRNWTEYKQGFGDLMNDFWLGLDRIHAMTSNQQYELLINLEDWKCEKRYAKYDFFSVGDEKKGYILNLGKFKGNAKNAFASHNYTKFTTKDVDNDGANWGNCGEIYKGGWWYQKCHQTNLNGVYNSTKHGEGVNWWPWHGYNYSLKYAEMAIRPRKS